MNQKSGFWRTTALSRPSRKYMGCPVSSCISGVLRLPSAHLIEVLEKHPGIAPRILKWPFLKELSRIKSLNPVFLIFKGTLKFVKRQHTLSFFYKKVTFRLRLGFLKFFQKWGWNFLSGFLIFFPKLRLRFLNFPFRSWLIFLTCTKFSVS